ncbi:MAG TPA: glycoside hydrolase family 97 N-terminal domain-containing protein, partial [Longimicrobium sp.]
MHARMWPLLAGTALALALFAAPADAQDSLRLASPDGKNTVTVHVREGGLYYAVSRNGQPVLLPSRLGFAFRGGDSLRSALRISGSSRNTVDQSWTQPWGEVARVRDHHHELRVRVAEDRAPNRRFAVVFRAFDDGVGFRYELADSAGFRDFEMMEELT